FALFSLSGRSTEPAGAHRGQKRTTARQAERGGARGRARSVLGSQNTRAPGEPSLRPAHRDAVLRPTRIAPFRAGERSGAASVRRGGQQLQGRSSRSVQAFATQSHCSGASARRALFDRGCPRSLYVSALGLARSSRRTNVRTSYRLEFHGPSKPPSTL